MTIGEIRLLTRTVLALLDELIGPSHDDVDTGAAVDSKLAEAASNRARLEAKVERTKTMRDADAVDVRAIRMALQRISDRAAEAVKGPPEVK